MYTELATMYAKCPECMAMHIMGLGLGFGDLEASTEEDLVGNVKNVWVSVTLPLKYSSASPQHGFLILKMLTFQQGMYSAGTSQRCWWTSSRWTCRSWTSQSSSMHVRGLQHHLKLLSFSMVSLWRWRHYHWEHAVFLYTHYDEYDQAANTMMVLSSVHVQVILLRIDSLEIARILYNLGKKLKIKDVNVGGTDVY